MENVKNKILMIGLIPNKCDFCGCCVGICPDDAIELKEYELTIIPESCTNCAKCVWACPVEALYFNKNGVLPNNDLTVNNK